MTGHTDAQVCVPHGILFGFFRQGYCRRRFTVQFLFRGHKSMKVDHDPAGQTVQIHDGLLAAVVPGHHVRDQPVYAVDIAAHRPVNQFLNMIPLSSLTVVPDHIIRQTGFGCVYAGLVTVPEGGIEQIYPFFSLENMIINIPNPQQIAVSLKKGIVTGPGSQDGIIVFFPRAFAQPVRDLPAAGLKRRRRLQRFRRPDQA